MSGEGRVELTVRVFRDPDGDDDVEVPIISAEIEDGTIWVYIK